MPEEVERTLQQKSIPDTISSCSVDTLRVMTSSFSPEPMPDDMRQVVQSSGRVDRSKLVVDVMRYGYKASRRGDVAIASVLVGALTNHWEVALAGYSYWMYFSSWSQRIEDSFRSEPS